MNSKLTDCSVAEHGYAVLTAETPSYNSKATDTKPIYSINPLTDIDCQQESGSGVIGLTDTASQAFASPLDETQVSPAS